MVSSKRGSQFGWEVTGVPSHRPLSLWGSLFGRGLWDTWDRSSFLCHPAVCCILVLVGWMNVGLTEVGLCPYKKSIASFLPGVGVGMFVVCLVSPLRKVAKAKFWVIIMWWTVGRTTDTDTIELSSGLIYCWESSPLMFEWRKFKWKDPSSSSSKGVYSLGPSTQVSLCLVWKQRKEGSPSGWSSLHLHSSSTLPWACPPRAELRGTQGSTPISFFPQVPGRWLRAKVRECLAGKSWLWTLPSSTFDLCDPVVKWVTWLIHVTCMGLEVCPHYSNILRDQICKSLVRLTITNSSSKQAESKKSRRQLALYSSWGTRQMMPWI